MDNKEKILDIVRQGNLSSKDTELWSRVIENITDELAPDVVWLLENTPNGLQMITENIREKTAAVRSGDIKAWETILKKEGDFLKSLKN